VRFLLQCGSGIVKEKQMAGGGNRRSREAIVAAHERERQVLQLFLRGLTWVEIARQIGLTGESGARAAFDRAVKRIPAKDVELLRKLQSERLNDARRRVYSELAGRQEQLPDPEHPGLTKTITVRPTIEEVYAGVDRIVRIEIREAKLYGLDAPKKSEVMAAVTGQPISDEELDIQLARLTSAERETFMMLVAKLQGRWVEPPAIEEGSVETTATAVQSNGARGCTSIAPSEGPAG